MNIYVPAAGNPKAKIVLLGEAPSYQEEEQLQPFVGPSGQLLNEQLEAAGIKRSDCWITNVSKYMVAPQPEDGRKIPFAQRCAMYNISYEQQLQDLRVEFSQLNPNIVVALGGTALIAVTGKEGIQSWRGSIVQGSIISPKVIGTYHPAHILYQSGEVRGYWTKSVQLFDLKRARKQSDFPDIRRPQRQLQVARSIRDIDSYFKLYRDYKNPAIDIEARNCIPICIGISFSPSHGICIPLWSHLCNIPEYEMSAIWMALGDFLAAQDVIGQNFGYDRDKLKRLGFLVRSLYSDTLYKAFCINPEFPKNLAFTTSIFTEECYYKDEGMYEGSLEDLYIGCARDACVTKEVDTNMQPHIDYLGVDDYYRKFLLPLHGVYAFREDNTAIEQVGFAVNSEERNRLIRKYITWDEVLRHDLYQLTGEYLNVNSPQQVSKLLYEKLGFPFRKGTGEETLTALINSVKENEKKLILEKILEARRVRKTTSTYLMSPADFDGRMRTSYFLCLDTGRSATSQQDPPIRPVYEYRDEKNVKKKKSLGMAFQTITKHGDIGADIRGMLVADEGFSFLQADSSQAEARVIFLLAEDYQALKDIDTHDYHALTASWFFGGTEDTHSKKNNGGKETPIRFAGKTLRHAGHLGASKKRAAIECNTQARKYKIPLTISEKQADIALKIFHSKQPNIQQVFHAGIRKALEKNRRLFAPVPYGIDAAAGGARTFFERWGDELFRQAYAYIPQRSVSENTKGAIRRIRERAAWIVVLCEAHDGIICRVPKDKEREAAIIIKEEFERPIDFSKCSLERGQLIIPCELEIGIDYLNLHKYKIAGAV